VKTLATAIMVVGGLLSILILADAQGMIQQNVNSVIQAHKCGAKTVQAAGAANGGPGSGGEEP